MKTTSQLRQVRKERQRIKLRRVSPNKLRLTVHRTNKHTYAQIIDDANSVTLVSASTVLKDAKEQLKSGANKQAAAFVGELIAKKAVAAGINEVAFDRSGFLYHGRIQTLADSAREHGLKF